MQKIIRNIKIFISSLFITSLSYADINNHKFLQDYQSIVNNIIIAYDDEKLNAQIFDINNKSYLNFLTSSAKYKKKGNQDIMGMQYYSDFQVRGKKTSFCFILYDSKSNLIENYQNLTNLKLYEIIEYLALHEMGHCLIMNFQFHRNINFTDPRNNELMADKFAIYMLYHQGKIELISNILEINKLLSPQDIHNNFLELQSFSNNLNNNTIKKYTDYKSLIFDLIN